MIYPTGQCHHGTEPGWTRLTILVPVRGELEGEEARGRGWQSAGWGIEAFWHGYIFETHAFFHSFCTPCPSLHFPSFRHSAPAIEESHVTTMTMILTRAAQGIL